jgi:hypothetical protein
MTSTVRKSTDKGLSRLKRAMDSNQNPLSPAEVDFVRTSCRILDIDSEEMINRIGKRALDKGNGQVRKVMAVIRAQLDELGKRVEAHRRVTPTPAFSTRTYDDMDAPARSLAHLQVCAKGLRGAMVGGFSKGIKVAKIALEDFKVTVARTGEAARGGGSRVWPMNGMTKGRRSAGLCWKSRWELCGKPKKGKEPKQGFDSWRVSARS